MFHYFKGKIINKSGKKLITNNLFGIEISYLGNQKDAELYLFPYLDDNKKTIAYFAFDSQEQKGIFENLLKISGIGPKTAFQIAQIPEKNLQNAIKTLDAKFFQSIQGIGPKSAKKILLELKGSFSFDDIQQLDIDQKLYKDIVKSLKGFGYDSDKIKSTLQNYDGKITKANISEVIKRLISKM